MSFQVPAEARGLLLKGSIEVSFIHYSLDLSEHLYICFNSLSGKSCKFILLRSFSVDLSCSLFFGLVLHFLQFSVLVFLHLTMQAPLPVFTDWSYTGRDHHQKAWPGVLGGGCVGGGPANFSLPRKNQVVSWHGFCFRALC